MATSAITEVYLSESRRRKKERGMTINLGKVSDASDAAIWQRDAHECGNPEMPIHQVANFAGAFVEAQHDAWHQVSNDDEVADANAKALDGDGGVEYDGEVRVSDLR